MRVVLQRVSEAAVTVDGNVVGEIGRGLLLLVGIAAGDDLRDVEAAAAKVAGLRIFPDEQGRMDRSVGDVGGAVLGVCQFTLLADVRKGRRPSFGAAAQPEAAELLVSAMARELEHHGLEVAHGSFGASMAVSLINDGPVTVVLDTQDGRLT